MGKDPTEIRFNPKQACVIKNIGPEKETALVLPAGIVERAREIICEQYFCFELECIDYLLTHPGLKITDLEIEVRKSGVVEEPDLHVLRVRGGEVIATMRGPKIKVVDE